MRPCVRFDRNAWSPGDEPGDPSLTGKATVHPVHHVHWVLPGAKVLDKVIMNSRRPALHSAKNRLLTQIIKSLEKSFDHVDS